MFSAMSLTVLALTFRSLIHFELIFVYGIRKGSNFILPHVDIQFSSSTLLFQLFIFNSGLFQNDFEV